MITYCKIVISYLCVFIFFSNYLIAQDNKYEEIIINNKIYKPGSGWLKVGEGYSYNSSLKSNEINTIVSLSFRIKNNYLQIGYHVSSDRFISQYTYQKLNNFYIATGLRKETEKKNISFFVGPSYSYGGYLFDNDSIGNKRYRGFSEIGFVAVADYTFKIFYDLGFGLSAYSSVNKNYTVFGIQAHFYFSGAFKGEIK